MGRFWCDKKDHETHLLLMRAEPRSRIQQEQCNHILHEFIINYNRHAHVVRFVDPAKVHAQRAQDMGQDMNLEQRKW